MKILYINHEKNLGGAAKSLIGIIEKMHDEQYEIYVLTPYKEGAFIQKCKDLGYVQIIYAKYYSCVLKNNEKTLRNKIIYFIVFFLSYIYNYILAYNLSKKISCYDIDIIHTNSSVINIGNFISKFTGINHIVHFREFVEEDFGWTFVPNKKIVLNYINKFSKKQIFISKILQKKYKTFFELKNQECIYNGVTLRYLNDNRIRDTLNLLIAGRIIPGKGQIDAIEAVNILVNRKQIKNIKLYIVGVGDKEYLKILKNKIKEYSLSDYVIFSGYIKDLSAFRTNIDYELVCSYSEAFGRVVIEGMLSENIIFAANAGAFTELIEDKIDGFLYEVKNYEDLANKIYDCYLGIYDLDLIRKNAKNKCLKYYSQETNAYNIKNVYMELVNEN